MSFIYKATLGIITINEGDHIEKFARRCKKLGIYDVDVIPRIETSRESYGSHTLYIDALAKKEGRKEITIFNQLALHSREALKEKASEIGLYLQKKGLKPKVSEIVDVNI